ncbi:MAG TPA: hypothetical protein VK689_02965 [Armatimonadota bacterium]|nr:hypothetical protein [Armatimonadota bacterium]
MDSLIERLTDPNFEPKGLIPVDEVSDSLRDALNQHSDPSKAVACARAAGGAEYRAHFLKGKVFIDRLPYGRVSIPLPEPPGLKWEPGGGPGGGGG